MSARARHRQQQSEMDMRAILSGCIWCLICVDAENAQQQQQQHGATTAPAGPTQWDMEQETVSGQNRDPEDGWMAIIIFYVRASYHFFSVCSFVMPGLLCIGMRQIHFHWLAAFQYSQRNFIESKWIDQTFIVLISPDMIDFMRKRILGWWVGRTNIKKAGDPDSWSIATATDPTEYQYRLVCFVSGDSDDSRRTTTLNKRKTEKKKKYTHIKERNEKCLLFLETLDKENERTGWRKTKKKKTKHNN